MDDDEYLNWNSESESDRSLGEYFRPSWPKTISFRLRSRIISATAKPADSAHPNVLRLHVHDSVIQIVVQTLLRWLPSSLCSAVRTCLPEWTLPTDLILKKQKDGWEEEFDTEIAIYKKLRCLQGLVIPICYGQVQYEGTRALLLSDIGGACVATAEGAILKEADLRSLFDQALTALANQGILHDDLKLDNFHLVDRAGSKIIMVVDLERISELPLNKDRASMVKGDVDWLMNAYREHLECLKYDGKLLPPLSHI
ncbi:hypothetical protein VTK73DRAFT_6930 [Phialemonium thermophilum]|uniref:Protein kinase domain-containing protein n=1 Tax=Phialemonium thermophilum TaxID=223376 RepID=A0ABR3WHJ5_9PEZI